MTGVAQEKTSSHTNVNEESTTDVSKLLGLTLTGEDSLRETRFQLQREIETQVQSRISKQPLVQKNQAQVTLTENALGLARAQFFPVLSANAGVDKTWTKPSQENTSTDTTSKYGSLSVTQNLFRGGQDVLDLEVKNNENKVAQLNAEEETLKKIYEMKSVAYRLNHTAMMALLKKIERQSALKVRELSERKRKAGLAGEVDLYQAQSDEARSESAFAKAVQEVTAAKQEFYFTWGAWSDEERNSLQNLVDKLSQVALNSQDAVPMSDSKYIIERIALLESENNRLQLAKQQRKHWLPNVDLTGTLGLSDSKIREQASDQFDRSTSVGLNLSWPLFAPTHRFERLGIEVENKVEQLQNLHSLEAAKFKKVSILTEIENLRAQQPLLLESFKRTLRLAEAQQRLYEAGAIDLFVLITANSQKQSALEAWYRNQADLQLASLKVALLASGVLPD